MNATVVDATAVPSAISVWSRYPTVYEINTWVWLWEQRETVTSSNVCKEATPKTEERISR